MSNMLTFQKEEKADDEQASSNYHPLESREISIGQWKKKGSEERVNNHFTAITLLLRIESMPPSQRWMFNRRERTQLLVTWSLQRKRIKGGILSTHWRRRYLSSVVEVNSLVVTVVHWWQIRRGPYGARSLLNISSARFMIVHVIESADGQSCRNVISVQCH